MGFNSAFKGLIKLLQPNAKLSQTPNVILKKQYCTESTVINCCIGSSVPANNYGNIVDSSVICYCEFMYVTTT